jgi:hypothetical protein
MGRTAEGAGLNEIAVRTYEINTKDEARGILRRYGWGGMIRFVKRLLSLYARSPAYRRFIKAVRQEGIAPENLSEYFGYGTYVGRK